MSKQEMPDIRERLQSIFEVEPLREKQFVQELSTYINELIIHDFDKLISILYRMDVSEKSLRSLLQENPGNAAGEMIAGLMIEREVQKIKSRQKYSRDENDTSEEERW